MVYAVVLEGSLSTAVFVFGGVRQCPVVFHSGRLYTPLGNCAIPAIPPQHTRTRALGMGAPVPQKNHAPREQPKTKLREAGFLQANLYPPPAVAPISAYGRWASAPLLCIQTPHCIARL